LSTNAVDEKVVDWTKYLNFTEALKPVRRKGQEMRKNNPSDEFQVR
jgi:hypothetical protein